MDEIPEYRIVRDGTQDVQLLTFGRSVVGKLDPAVNGEFIESALNEKLGRQRAAIENARVED